MAQIGDTVRYLNQKGGGKIVRIDGKVAYVEEDGFEMPVLLKDVVVVFPAGAEKKAITGANLIFNQENFDRGRMPAPEPLSKEIPVAAPQPNPKPAPRPEQTPHGDIINLSLAFEPSDIHKLDRCRFNAVLVNDSNYELSFIFLTRSEQAKKWSVKYAGNVLPNELIDLASFATDELPELDKIAIQYIAFKHDTPYEMQAPGSVARRLDLTKFYKLHCFRPGLYFDSPVLEVPLVKDGEPVRMLHLTPQVQTEHYEASLHDKNIARELSDKFRVEKRNNRQSKKDSIEQLAKNPNKLLPPVEVDLHIHELIDSTAGMSNTDMMNLQLDTVRKTMKAHARRIGQKIIFIHGKGDGVLRKAVLDLLKREYPKAELQDASFAEYGFGATLVTLH